MIDASIPLQGLLINRNDENLKQQRFQQGQLQMQQMQEENENRRRLGDLLPQAVQGDQGAIAQLYAVDPNIAMKLDERQREALKAKTDDLTAAVRWADTPEKWAQVQQHYGQEGINLAPYRFEDREQGLLALGKLGDYLKAGQSPNQPSSVREYEYARSQGFNGSFMDYQNQMGSPIVQRNEDGTMTVIPRSVIGGAGRPAQSGGPRPGTVEDGYRFKGGDPADPSSWVKVGGQTASPSGPFPPAGN